MRTETDGQTPGALDGSEVGVGSRVKRKEAGGTMRLKVAERVALRIPLAHHRVELPAQREGGWGKNHCSPTDQPP